MKFRRPRHGDTRIREKFAWLPTEMSDGVTVWLEFYLLRERFHHSSDRTGSAHRYWHTTGRDALYPAKE